VGHGGWAGHTAVGYGGLACRRSARRFVASAVSHGGWPPNPWGLTVTSEPLWPTAVSPETAMGHGDRRGPWRMDVKSVKFSNNCIFLQNDFQKNIKKSRWMSTWPGLLLSKEVLYLIFMMYQDPNKSSGPSGFRRIPTNFTGRRKWVIFYCIWHCNGWLHSLFGCTGNIARFLRWNFCVLFQNLLGVLNVNYLQK
jgi:hypothetical protein